MRTQFTVEELKRLHALGFTLLWIKPRSKAPVDTGWTKKPRQTFESFQAEYRKGFNVGVRLGEISEVDFLYLAVLDVDVKGTLQRYQDEAKAKLFDLFSEVKGKTYVVSGRGNGSAHYYVFTETPLRGNERKAASSEIVKVKMPSVRASQKELDTLTPEEIQAGLRLRAAWEISLMSEGRQCLLPGSIHPDSGQPYKWGPGVDPTRLKIPLIRAGAGISAASKPPAAQSPTPAASYKLRDVDLSTLGLRPDQEAAIESGAGVTDRSASIFALTMALLQRRVSEADILSVFTDRKNYLGQTPYDHAKTSNRNIAVQWLLKYTLPKARQQTQTCAFAFEVKEESTDNGGDWVDENEPGKEAALEKIPSQPNGMKEIGGNGAEAYASAADWKFDLDLQPGPKGSLPCIRATLKNIRLILMNTITQDFLRFDEFASREFWGCSVPWGPQANDQRSAGTGDEIKLKAWLIDYWGVEVSVNMLTETLAWFSGQNHFHPVKDYLETLTWDGIERIDTAFETYLKGINEPELYVRAVSRKFFLALMARIYQPGCKFDFIPVLEGFQGRGKSTFGRILVGDAWFMDGLPELSDKDAALNLQGIWLCEMGELSSLYRSQLEVAKAFISRQVDKVRPPYGARRVDLPRQTVFFGTTNDREYLIDPTGNRRFWPMGFVTGCDFKGLARDREQLLAEAHWKYLTEMEPLYLDNPAVQKIA